ncbi:MAG: hypothetical protein A2157_05045 [Deltaproteobacteria bacterium RBG_16_47_11]|nr:MAG: hypothetical protein A2157_05045 [Deltaproteobacteria bacterium RBG_16_47_11]
MKLDVSGSNDRMTRREFLRRICSKKDSRVIINKGKCTGCGRCTVDCPTRALILSRGGNTDVYQLSFRPDLCDTCGFCERSCPESCLQLAKEIAGSNTDKKAGVIFEDKMCRCIGCGLPLFPQAMMKIVISKVFKAGEPTWPFNLCPSCRAKSQFEGKRIEKGKT